MPCPSAIRAARRSVVAGLALVLAALLPGVLGGASAAAGPRQEADPLLVSIDAMSPAVPRQGSVHLRGTVTNASAEPWTAVNLHVFNSTSPITDAPSLAASASLDPGEYVGARITEPGTFATVDALEPGQSAEFAVEVPVELLGLSGEPGVYWIGIQALGDSSVPRDEFADGRARTFIPLATPDGPRDQVESAIVLPLRADVWHRPDGRLDRVRRWTRSLSDGGRLEGVLDVADAAATTPLTWLVDPAVLSAVSRLAAGNPARSLAPDPAVDQGEAPEQADPSASDTPDPAVTDPASPTTPVTPTPSEEAPELTEAEQAAADAATAWLDRFRVAVAGRTVLALPYGDLDVSATVRHSPTTLQHAFARSGQVLSQLGIAARPAAAPRDGVLSAEALQALPPEATVLLRDTAFALPPEAPHSMVRLLGHKVALTSSGVAEGGPLPTPADDPLALRQRLLSEAALRLRAGSRAPLVVVLPSDWRPDDPGALFGALGTRWLEPVPLDDVLARPARSMTADDLAYTEEDLDAELDARTFAAAERLGEKAALLEQVLTRQTTVEGQVLDEVLANLSEGRRATQARALESLAGAAGHLDGLLGSVRVEAPRKVTLSSATGSLGATVVNGIDQPVTVRIRADSDGALELQQEDALQLAASSRTRVLLDVTATRQGRHDVRLVVTSDDGTPLGSSQELPIRAAQVSDVIWIAMAAGSAMLFLAIALRVVRRVREVRTEEKS